MKKSLKVVLYSLVYLFIALAFALKGIGYALQLFSKVICYQDKAKK